MKIEKTEDAKQVNRVFAVAFHTDAEKGPAGKGTKIQHWGAFDGDAMMATVSAEALSMNFDGRLCPMAAVGGVATLPQYRGQGCIREIFRRMLPELYDGGCDFSYLYAFSNAFYRQFGYESCVQLMEMTVDLGQLRPEKTVGRWELRDPAHPLTAPMEALDRLWEERYNMMVRREMPEPPAPGEQAYVWWNSQGQPGAYVIFRRVSRPTLRGFEELDLRCSRLRFADREGFQAVLGLLRTMAADCRLAVFSLPAGCGMEYLLPEWSLHAADRRVQTAGMVRVINVMEVLKKARYRGGSGEMVLELQDDVIKENCGRFRVRYRDGRAEALERTDKSPDAVLTIAAFSALVCGVAELSQAGLWMKGVEIRNDRAEALFYRKPMMVNSYF